MARIGSFFQQEALRGPMDLAMMLNWTRAIGRAMLTIAGWARYIPLGIGIAAAVLAVWAIALFIQGQVPTAIVVLALAALVLLFLQSGLRGDWRAIVPNSAAVVMAACVAFGVHLYAAGSPLPWPGGGEPAERAADESAVPEHEVQTVYEADGAKPTEPVVAMAEPAPADPPAPAVDIEPAPFMTAAGIARAWDVLDQGRTSDAPEPERTALSRLIRAGAGFVGRDLSFLTLSHLDFRTQAEGDGEGRDMTRARLYGARFECTNLEGAMLAGAAFAFPEDVRLSVPVDARYTDARFANFRAADLDGAQASGTDFRFANFEDTDFGTAQVRNAVFDYANLAGANLRFVSGLDPEQLRHACVNADTEFPATWDMADKAKVSWSRECREFWGRPIRSQESELVTFARYSPPSGGQDRDAQRYYCD